MKSQLLFTVVLSLFSMSISSQTTFQKTYCTGSSSYSFSVYGHETTDGGFVLGGASYDTLANIGYVHLIKTDGMGVITQEKSITIDGFNFSSQFMQPTSDGGYIIANWNNVVKLDSSFNVQWAKSYNDTSWYGSGEYGTSVCQTFDGGYLVSTDLQYVSQNSTGKDFQLLKLDANGNLQWARRVYTPENDIETSTKQTMDGGYIIAGYSYPYFGGDQDIALVKTDASGGVLWSGLFGGTSDDKGTDVIQLPSGEYIVTGTSASFGVGQADIFLMKVNASGSLLWSKTYGGSANENGGHVARTSDGGYILSGYTESFGNAGDVLFIKTDSSGNVMWSKKYGGNGFEGSDNYVSISQTTNGGYYAATFTADTNYAVICTYAILTDSGGNSGCTNNQTNVTLITLTPSFQSNTYILVYESGVLFSNLSATDTVITSQTGNCLPTSVNEAIRTGGMTIFPNPTPGKFTIDTKIREGTISIYNMFGEVIFLSTVQTLPQSTINLSGQPNGVYIMNIAVENGMITQRIIISK